jgi:hypothetical protein
VRFGGLVHKLWRNPLPPSSPEHGGSRFACNTTTHLPNCTVSYPRRVTLTFRQVGLPALQVGTEPVSLPSTYGSKELIAESAERLELRVLLSVAPLVEALYYKPEGRGFESS